MVDIADVLTADPDLSVVLDGATVPAVTIEGTLYQPTEGDRVVTIPLSDGRVLILGPTS